jgi:mannose-P-dolichol utilization defect protein 1
MSSDFAQLASRLLSAAIVCGSLTMQAPQIYQIIKVKSAKGLTITGWAISVMSMTFSCSYNSRKEHPFFTWGEQMFIMVQLDVLIMLVEHYERGGLSWKGPLIVALHAVLAAGCLDERMPEKVLITVPIPLSCISALPQLFVNHRNRHTGQLAWLPVFFAVLGLTIRLFTTMTSVGDPMVLITQAVPCFLNSLLLLQLFTLPGGNEAAKKGE